MTTRSVTVRAGITRSANYQSISFEIAEQVDLGEGEDRDEVVREVRQRLFTDVDEYTMRGIIHLGKQAAR